MRWMRHLRIFSAAPLSISGEQNWDYRRRHRLIVPFGLIGLFFSLLYGAIYYVIGFKLAAFAIAICIPPLFFIPFLLERPNAPWLAGNIYAFLMWLAFFFIAWLEGGHLGHTLAWLVSVPFVALLLASTCSAWVWGVISISSIALFGMLDQWGIQLPPHHPPSIAIFIRTFSSAGLIAFVFILAYTLEQDRRLIFQQLEETANHLTVANQSLQRLDTKKSDFLNVVAHDLNNPLCAVLGSTELIQMVNKGQNPDIERYAQAIVRSSNRMREIIADLVEINYLEQLGPSVVLEKMDMSSVLQEIIPDHQSNADAKGLKLHCQYPDSPALVAASPRMLHHVMDNLLSNAIKYSPKQKEIFVRVLQRNQHVILEVEDQGPGIQQQDRSRLFHKFAPLTARPTAGESSTGLGLSIVKTFTENMHGTVLCPPHPTGAIFVVTFPSFTN
jgi:signal transduction histidine kinase